MHFGILTHEYNHTYTSQCNINVSALRFTIQQKSGKQKSSPHLSSYLLPLTSHPHSNLSPLTLPSHSPPYLSPLTLTLTSHPHPHTFTSHPHPHTFTSHPHPHTFTSHPHPHTLTSHPHPHTLTLTSIHKLPNRCFLIFQSSSIRSKDATIPNRQYFS